MSGNDVEVVIRRTGVRDVRRAMRGVEEKALSRALVDTRHTIDSAATAAVDSILTTVNTSGAGMPYKHDPHTDARVWTGAMRDSVGVRWEQDNSEGFTVFIGFVEGPDYAVFQEEGTRKLAAMAALAKARAIVEDALDRSGNLVEATK